MFEKVVQYGALNSLKRSMLFLLRLIGVRYNKWLICHQDINELNLTEIELNSNYICKEMCLSDFINSGRFTQKKIESFSQRFESKGFHAFGLFYGSDLAYYCWISLSDFVFSDDSYSLEMRPSEGLLFDAFCFKEHRRFGLHNYMNIYRLKQLLNCGKSTALVVLLKENIPARRSQSTAGFRCSSQVITYNIFGYTGHILKKKIIQLI